MREKEKSFGKYFLLFGLISLALFVSFVYATTVETSTGLTPYYVGNGSTFTYNISIDATNVSVNNITQVRILLPYNGTGEGKDAGITYVAWVNYSNVNNSFIFANITNHDLMWNWTFNDSLINQNQTRWFAFNATINATGNYNISVGLHSNTSLSGNETTTWYNISVHVYNRPIILFGTAASGFEATGTNMSQNWTYVAVDWNTSHLSNMTFTIFNTDTGAEVNRTNFTYGVNLLNWTGLTDGNYTYEVNISDGGGTNNNTNTTGQKNIRIDTTPPNTTFSCTPTSVDQGYEVVCTCGYADGGTGILYTNYTNKPSTGITGSYSPTCVVTDFAGNNATSTGSYTITAPGGSAPSGGGTTYKGTIVEDEDEFSDVGTITKQIEAKNKVRIKINDEEYNIGIVEVTSTTATIEIPETGESSVVPIGGEKRFDVDADGYYDIKVTLNSIEEDKADVTMSYIHEEIPPETTEGEPTGLTEKVGGIPIWVWIIIGIIVVVILVVLGIKAKKK